ncbi:hypothetical protein PQC39_gp128 [Vibrio phage Vp_R1]|uniref:Uncharacterized protein n=1 Tax=Vibrio phage Vp_R1 TaxID=2059867 RepID=A0A2H5BQC2_9CAUD|nr:hypothetical protein PQC39_gp128 [Vibrio phage Vp_R1]AUG88492.1 hypothetical protein VPR_128 [Vibrio phage Vp_R1]
MEPEVIAKKRKGALDSSETMEDVYSKIESSKESGQPYIPDFIKQDLAANGITEESLATTAPVVSKKTGHVADADSYTNVASGVTPDSPEGKDKGIDKKTGPLYKDPKMPKGKKTPLPPAARAPLMKGSNPNSKRSGEGDRRRAKMLNDWLSQRRDTSFEKYRGAKSYTNHQRPRGILSN